MTTHGFDSTRQPSESIPGEFSSSSPLGDPLTTVVDNLMVTFPGKVMSGLRVQIVNSFAVPQMGPYHNEGPFMEWHLALMFSTKRDVEVGLVHPSIPEDVAELIRRTVRSDSDQIDKFVYLHDVRKAACMTLHMRDGSRREIREFESFGLVPSHCRFDPQGAYKALSDLGIDSISYFQEKANRYHGPMAASQLSPEAEKYGLSEKLLQAIRLHEVAFGMDSPRAGVFEKNFGALSAEEMAFLITAVYLDLMSSLRSDRTPELKPLLILIAARKNFETISYVSRELGDGGARSAGINQGKLHEYLQTIMRATDIPGDREEVVERVRQQFKFKVYSRELLTSELAQLVADKVISVEVVDAVLACVEGVGQVMFHREALGKLRKTFSNDVNAKLSQALARAEV